MRWNICYHARLITQTKRSYPLTNISPLLCWDVQTTYIHQFHQLRPSQLKHSNSCSQCQIIPIFFVFLFRPDKLLPQKCFSGMNSRADASLTPKILLSSIQSSNNIDPTRPYNVNLIPSYASLTTISLRDPLVLATLRPYIGRINTERKI